jgi:hypothetical protein
MASQDPLENMRMSRTEAGLWIAESDSSGAPHPLGLVVPEMDRPAAPTIVLRVGPLLRRRRGTRRRRRDSPALGEQVHCGLGNDSAVVDANDVKHSC